MPTLRGVTDELARLDATAQADLVARGEVSHLELVDAAIERIERLDDQLNAVIHRRFERARAEAPTATGPFAGVPFLVKDAVCHTAGDPYHAGMRALKDVGWVEPDDTWLAARFRAAGFVFVGKTNTPELATSVTTEPLAYGPTHNPWDLSRSTGGSSGGSAAAVAAGLVPVAHGNDMGGSIRFPASMCGIVGLKPTRARTTLGPDFGEYWGPLTHEFVLTRSVRDTAAVLDAVCGAGPGDPYTAPPPARPYADEVERRSHGRPADRVSHHDARRRRVARRRRGRGRGDRATPVDARPRRRRGRDPGARRLLQPGVRHRPVDRGRARRRALERTARARHHRRARAGERVLRVDGRTRSGASTTRPRSRTCRHGPAGSRRGGKTTTCSSSRPAPNLPFASARSGPTNTDPAVGARMGRLVTFCSPFDVTGQPAISLPLHWNDDGLPIGVQLVAAYGREDVLLRVAAQLEAARPWRDRRPPVHA